MWNQALRRVVHAEEKLQEERRRLQLAQAAASAAAATAATESGDAPSDAVEGATNGTGAAAAGPIAASADSRGSSSTTRAQDDSVHAPEGAEGIEEEDDDDFLQKHLLSRPTASWRCLEDSQQANCLALNRRGTLLAVGERDGRVSIWDNVSIRVITRELDPTLLVLPSPENGQGSVTTDTQTPNGTSSHNSTEKNVATADDDGDASVENDDASVENDDASVEPEDDEDDDTASVEDDGDVATEEDNDAEDDHDDHNSTNDKPEQEEDENAASKDENDAAVATDDSETPTDQPLLSVADLRVAKSSLKVVTQCAWSCDSRWVLAGCEEKSTRRARLCVWDVEAATLLAAFRFDAAITSLSTHPYDPNLVLVSYCNSRPVLLDVHSGKRSPLTEVPLENAQFAQPPQPSNSRHPSLLCCARFGRSGTRIYCSTSRSTLAVLDTTTLELVVSAELTVLVQFVDLSVDSSEKALLVTSSKGIHEFSLMVDDTDTASGIQLQEVALHSTGAVRAPWALCCFSGKEDFVVGTPVVRHRHVGENGLYTWHRGTLWGKTTAQHNVGVKDGVLSLAWDQKRESVVAVSTTGSLYVLEEQFTTTWPGPMYPAGFRLITDNELHVEAFDRDEAARKREKEELTEAARLAPIDVFTEHGPEPEFPVQDKHSKTQESGDEIKGLRYLPAIPIAYHHRRHLQPFQGASYHEEKHFGLGQSVFEPLKGALGKPKLPSSGSKGKSRTRRNRSGGGSRSQKRRRR